MQPFNFFDISGMEDRVLGVPMARDMQLGLIGLNY